MSLRASRGGDAFDLEMKMQKRYDKEEELGVPQRIVDWILKVVGNVDNGPKNGVYDWKAVHALLKDGVVLCKLMNRLLKHVGLPTFGYRPSAPSSFVAIANIDSFANAARQYGVSEMSIFQSADLYEGRKGQLINVLHCLNQLGKIANARGYTPAYEGTPPPKPDWALVNDDF
jgi:hypothetical protein